MSLVLNAPLPFFKQLCYSCFNNQTPKTSVIKALTNAFSKNSFSFYNGDKNEIIRKLIDLILERLILMNYNTDMLPRILSKNIDLFQWCSKKKISNLFEDRK